MADHSLRFTLTPQNNARLSSLCGEADAHLRYLEARLDVAIANRAYYFDITGTQKTQCQQAQYILMALYKDTAFHTIMQAHIDVLLNPCPAFSHAISLPPPAMDTSVSPASAQSGAARREEEERVIWVGSKRILARTPTQQRYLAQIKRKAVCFGVGPAGTGKTYIAVASALSLLLSGAIKRIVLVRPAVEAGERLGFLPGSMHDKIDPYLRPLYDAMFEMLGVNKIHQYREQGSIEVIPLAFMRGRTLHHTCMIMDEAQNTTPEQMKMFLTRMGTHSKVIINGDVTQVDLPARQTSGLVHALRVLAPLSSIAQVYFHAQDVLRHPLIKMMIEAYAQHEKQR